MKEKNIKLSLYIKSLRKEKGWTMTKLAEKAEISLEQLKRIEKGNYDKAISPAAKKVLAVFGKSDEDLLMALDPQIKRAFDHQVAKARDFAFKKDHMNLALELSALKQTYQEYEPFDYIKQTLLLLEGTVFYEKDTKNQSLTLLTKALKLSRSDLIVSGGKKNITLDTDKIHKQAFSKLEYHIITEIANGLAVFGQYVHAIEIYQVLLLSYETNYTDELMINRAKPVILYNLAFSFNRLQAYQEAVSFGQQGIDVCKQTGNTRPLLHLYKLMGDIHRHMGHCQKANDYMESYEKLLGLLERSQ